MGVVVADRVERPPSLFDLLDGPAAPATTPEHPSGLERRLLREREAEAAEALVEPARTAGRPAIGDAPAVVGDLEAGGAGHVHDGVGGEPTLDDLLVGAWEGLTAQVAVACPLCDGALRPLYADGAAGSPVVAGRCDGCDTTLT
ncbi:MAG TPA: hypothetical protein VLK58_23235 [Conexibacter sp.]|nr:hypothetical protein [Conexibacter sp.]